MSDRQRIRERRPHLRTPPDAARYIHPGHAGPLVRRRPPVGAPEGSPDRKGTLAVTGDYDADHLVNTDPLALLLAMWADQHMP